MDQTSRPDTGNFIALTGWGLEVAPAVWRVLTGEEATSSDLELSHDCNPAAFLKARKTLKFMSKQDRLALGAAAAALQAAGAPAETLKTACGIFMAVGYIPFRLGQALEFADNSEEDGRFSMQRFATTAFAAVNPLLAFSCLPNMPAHHLAANFNIQGQYFITYPDTAQFYQALSEAQARLNEGSLDMALVGGVADQTNFLTANHFRKTESREESGEPVARADAAAFLVLEPEAKARQRGARILARLCALEYEQEPELAEAAGTCGPPNGLCLGAATVPALLAAFLQGGQKHYTHCLATEHGKAFSRWEVV